MTVREVLVELVHRKSVTLQLGDGLIKVEKKDLDNYRVTTLPNEGVDMSRESFVSRFRDSKFTLLG